MSLKYCHEHHRAMWSGFKHCYSSDRYNYSETAACKGVGIVIATETRMIDESNKHHNILYKQLKITYII